jgi:hypothetical protein
MAPRRSDHAALRRELCRSHRRHAHVSPRLS